MNIERLTELCRGLNGVTTDVKWENHLCFCIGEKMFLVLGLDETPTTASFKVTAESFEEWIARPGCIKAPYLGRYKWVAVDNIARFDEPEWKAIIQTAYSLIGSKLSGKLKKELGIG